MTKRMNYKYSKKFQYVCPIINNNSLTYIPMIYPEQQFDGCLEKWISEAEEYFTKEKGLPPKYTVIARIELEDDKQALGICCLDNKPKKTKYLDPTNFL